MKITKDQILNKIQSLINGGEKVKLFQLDHPFDEKWLKIGFILCGILSYGIQQKEKKGFFKKIFQSDFDGELAPIYKVFYKHDGKGIQKIFKLDNEDAFEIYDFLKKEYTKSRDRILLKYFNS